MNSASDTTVKASTVVADGDVHIQTGGNFTEESVEETSESTYVKQVKKSGLLSGGGLGFTIGKEKKKDQYTNKNTEQVGSTIGSVNGNVSINSNKETSVQASEVIAKKDISITAENVNVASKDNISNHQEKHEYKRTGITVSLGGQVVQSATGIVNNIKRGAEVQDKRLAALYGYEAGKQIKEDGKAIKDAISGKGGIGITVGFSSSSSKSESKSMQTEAASSRVNAGENVNLTSAKDITIQGSDVSGKNVNLKAGENLNISSAEQTSTNTTKQSGKGGSIGVTFGGGLPVTVSGSVYSNKENENGSSVTHRNSTVRADQTLTVESQKDTNILGSKAEGNKVVANVGGNLTIESQQDRNNYNSKSSSMGASFSTNLSNKTSGGRVEASKGKINSNYQSVTEQAGIYAGNEGFDIQVKKNTDLKGAVIDSNATAEKNKLTTGTLTWEDIQNKAHYDGDGKTIGASTKSATKKNPLGLSYTGSIPVKGDSTSITHSAIAQGIIQTADQKKEVDISRDTKNAMNKLSEIFDKKKVKEKQELVGMMAKTGFTLVGDIAARKMKELIKKAEEAETANNKELADQYRKEANKWKDGGAYKTGLHGIVGALVSLESGHGIGDGLKGAAVNEALQNALSKIKDPELHKLGSALIGSLVGGKTGGAIAESATENNWLSHSDQMNFMNDYEAYKSGRITEEEFKNKLAYYFALMLYEKNFLDVYGNKDNVVSGKFYDSVLNHGDGDVVNRRFNDTDFETLMVNMVNKYIPEEEKEHFNEVVQKFTQEFTDSYRVVLDSGARIKEHPEWGDAEEITGDLKPEVVKYWIMKNVAFASTDTLEIIDKLVQNSDGTAYKVLKNGMGGFKLFLSGLEDAQVYSGENWVKAQEINLGSEMIFREIPTAAISVYVIRTTDSLMLAVAVGTTVVVLSGMLQDKLTDCVKDLLLEKDSDKQEE